jgi:ketosteroid isomerase-like protein
MTGDTDMRSNQEIVRDSFRAYETGDRQLVETLLADDFTFSSPADVAIDRARYFERCWPNAGNLAHFAFTRVIESGDEVIVTYEAERVDGSRFRNTEVHTVAGGKVRGVEVYFGWNL